MNKYYKSIIASLLGVVTFTSCADKLDVTNPNKFTDEQIMELLKNGTDDERDLILGGLASNMRGNVVYRGSIMYGGFTNMSYDNEMAFALSRNLQCGDMVYGDQSYSSSVGVHAMCYRNDPTYEYWRKDQTAACYGYWAAPSIIINNANKVAMFLDDDIVANSTKLKDYRARALVIWGLGYLELMERFTKSYLHGGKDSYGMPIYERFAYQETVKPSTAEETWSAIKTKLRLADKMFEESGIGTEGFTVGTDPDIVYDLDRGMALYLLARADLETGDYAECITSCKKIMDMYNWQFIKEEHYGVDTKDLDAICDKTKEIYADDNAFLSAAVNPECMFGWCTDGNVYGWAFFNTFYGAEYRIDDTLYNKFDDNDYRKARFSDHEVEYPFLSSKDVEVPSSILQYSSLKYSATIASGKSARTSSYQNSDVIVYRTSEVLLMMAEAQALSGDAAGAKETLNKLLAARTTAGATPLTCDTYPAMKGMSALDMVKLQWRMEMWGERDCIWRCYKRWNEAPERNTNSTTHWNFTTFSLDHMTWEIPQEEQSSNPYWIDLIYK